MNLTAIDWAIVIAYFALSLAIPTGEPARHVLDGVAVSTRPDRRGA